MTAGRQAQWTVIRKLQIFKVQDISKQSQQKILACRAYITCLEAGGFVEITNGKTGLHAELKLIKDNGFHAPKVNKKGDLLARDSKQDAIWRGIRNMNIFTIQEMMIALQGAGIQTTKNTVSDYCTILVKAGYLIVTQKGSRLRPAIYQLVWNSGPKSPSIRVKKQVFDPNTKDVVWREGETTS